ncbi:MAG: class I SAM-dependent methyltransferase [Bacteriovoracaceae bacterium]
MQLVTMKLYYHAPMTLKLLKENKLISPVSAREKLLEEYCQAHQLEVTFEWINGQYWLHSQNEKERPIGIEIDQELKRHEDFFKKSSLQKELLAKAIGVKGPHRPKILDLSSGLLGDSLLFLSFGCEVISLERNPIVAFLIFSAMENAQHPSLSRFKFYQTEALTFLESRPEVEVIYFDPMFEDANAKSLPKKEMRIFRDLVGKDTDSEEVFKRALEQGVKRVVVKRPRLSIPLLMSPPLEFVGKSTRYDVYLSQNNGPFASNLLK